MTKEMMRLLLLQVAGFASVFGTFSPRIRAAVAFLVAVCQPEVFDLLWNAVSPHATIQTVIRRYKLFQTPPAGEADQDPFAWVDHTSGGVNNPVGNTPAVTEQAQGGPKPGKGGT
jgi:hypothetical protein